MSTNDNNVKPTSGNHDFSSYKGDRIIRLTRYVYFHTCAPNVWITVTTARTTKARTFKVYATTTHMSVTYRPVLALGYVIIIKKLINIKKFQILK